MDPARYVLALLVLVGAPPAFLLWLIVHPFVGVWRRLEPAWSYALLGALVAAGMVGMFQLRRPALAIEFGTRAPLVALGAVLVLVALFLAVLVRRELSVAVQLGLPELAPERHPGRLLTEGIYARIRHPRYVSAVLGLLGWAFLTNYLAVYLVALGSVPLLYAVVLLEERELRDRFGVAYEEYSRRVPRFLPRRRRAS